MAFQIAKESQKLKVLLQEYNFFCAAAGEDTKRLSFADAVDSARLAQLLHLRSSSYSEKKQELLEAYLLLCRSGEELDMLKCDMQNAISYYESRVKLLETAIESPTGIVEEFKSGAHALLLAFLQDTHKEVSKLRELFSDKYLYPQHKGPDSDSSSDDESDYDSED